MSSLRQKAIEDLTQKAGALRKRPRCLLCQRRTIVTDAYSAKTHVNSHFKTTIKCVVCQGTLPHSQKLSETYNFLRLHYELTEGHSPVCPYQILHNKTCVFTGPDHFEKHRQIGHVLWKCEDLHEHAEEEYDDELSSDSDMSDNDVGDDSDSDEDILEEEYHCLGFSRGSDDGGGGDDVDGSGGAGGGAGGARGGGGDGGGGGGGDGDGSGGGGGAGGGGGVGGNFTPNMEYILTIIRHTIDTLQNTYAATELIINHTIQTIWNLITYLRVPMTEQQRKKVKRLKTSYGRQKNLNKQSKNFRQCINMTIGDDPFLPVRIPIHFYSVTEMIKLFLRSKDNWERVQQFHTKQTTPGMYNSIKNSQMFQQLSLRPDEPVLPLAIACDEIQPLGSLYAANNTYKLYNFYLIMILEGTTQRKLEQVFPLVLLYSRDVGQIGIEKVTEQIAEQFTEVVLNGIIWKGRQLQVRVIYIIGDNLSQNQLSGITRSWSHGKSCRYCHFVMADLANANSADDLSSGANRTSQEYMEVIVAESNNDILPHGFTNVPALHRIPYFAMNTTTFSLDLDHDFFLGCAVTWMTIIVNHLVFQLQWVSPSTLKTLWKRFKFRRQDAKNRAYFKFDIQKKEIKICNKVAHVRHLILLFSTVLYSKVQNPREPVWQFYLKVAHLTRLLLTKNHNDSSLEQLELYIKGTLNARMNLTRTPTGEYHPKLKSKEHNLTHYATAIRWAGPLSLQSSALCEQFHQFTKRAFGNSRCTKNLLKTVLKRIDGKLISRVQEDLQIQKLSRLRKEDGLDREAVAFYRQYNFASRLRSFQSSVGPISINDVVGCPGAPDGRFFHIVGLAQTTHNIKILADPMCLRPLGDYGLFEVIRITNSRQVFPFDPKSMLPVNAYEVQGKRVISQHNFDLNMITV